MPKVAPFSILSQGGGGGQQRNSRMKISFYVPYSLQISPAFNFRLQRGEN